MQALIWGSLIGLGCGAIAQVMHLFVHYELTKLRLVPWAPSRKSRFMRRIRRVLFSRNRGRLILLYSPLLPLAVLGWILFLPTLSMGLVLGYLAIPLTVHFINPAWLRNYRQKIQKLAVDRLMRHGLEEKETATETLEILAGFAENSPTELQVYTLRQIARIGTPESRPVLERFQQSPDNRIQTASESAIETLDRILSGKNILSAKQLPIFIDEIDYWNRQYYSRKGLESRESESKQAELVEIVNDIVDSQLRMKQAFPHLLCMKCLTRADEHYQGQWTYVLCRHCGDVLDLKKDIQTVVGLIGKSAPALPQNGVLYLTVWDSEHNKARFADLDRLEIIAGADLNYDWAVSAVVAQLREHAPEPDWRIPVSLIGNPPLDANSRRLLDEITLKP